MRKSLILLLMLVVVFSGVLAACGSNSNDTVDQVDSQQPNDNVGGNESEGNVEEVVEPIDDGSEKLEVTMMLRSFSGGGWSDKHPMIDYLNDKFNMDLKIQWVPSGNYIEKLNVLAASNSFPDVFVVTPNEFRDWNTRGAFLDLKPHLSNFQNLSAHIPEDAYQKFSPKGKYFGFPIYVPETRDSLAIRKDWLDNLNLKIPTNVEELYEVAKAFAKDDPDGNGSNDTIGLSFNLSQSGKGGNFVQLDWLLGGAGMVNGWGEVDGKLIPDRVQTEELKTVISFLRKGYEEGIIDRDFSVLKGSAHQDKWVSGKLGIMYVNPNNAFDQKLPELKKIHPEAEIVQLIPPKGPTGLQTTGTTDGGNLKIVVNNNIDEKKQQRILKFMDYLLSDEGFELSRHGIEGIHYKKKEDGSYEKLPAFDEDRPWILCNWWLKRYDPMFAFNNFIDPEMLAKVEQWFDTNQQFKWPNEAPGLITEFIQDNKQNLDTKQMQTFVKVIMSELPIEAVEQSVEEWRANGGDQIIEEMRVEYEKQ
jgi:putative aldouronate transport system substrate-binding protein